MFGKTAQVKQLSEAPGDFLFPNGVAVDKSNNVYISDGDNRRIQVFSSEGNVQEVHRLERRPARYRDRPEAATLCG